MSDTTDLARVARGTLWSPTDADPAVILAADELAHYVGRLTGITPARATVPGDGAHLWLGPNRPERSVTLAGEAAIEASAEAIALTGATPRATLAAVYRLLAAAGCRWSPRGVAHEDIPRDTALPVRSSIHRPAFARRAYASDLTTWHYTMPERFAARLPQDLAFIDWMAKTGATGWLFIRHAHDDRWLLPELVPALRTRGLAVEWGGHGLVEWLPRDAFAAHPEYFPQNAAGDRTDMGNCCTDNAEGLALIRAGVRSARAAAGSDDLHLWGLDLFGGGWCHCLGCRALTPSDQALRLANAVADDLSHGERVFHLAYHDTFSPPRSVLPHPRVWAEFAPRERCYAHAIDDPTCHANPRYRAALEAHLAWFDGRVEVFEYYADTILFGGCAVPLIEVIARDLAYYQRVGVGGVSCLTFGRFSHLAHGANLTAFAAGTHDPRTTRAGAHDHCRDAFGPAAALAAQYLRSLERAIAPVLTWGDVKVPPRTADAANALAQAVATRTLLEEGLRKLPASPRADAERRLFHYTLNTLDGLRRLCPPGHDADAVLATLHDLAASFHDVDLDHAGTWGTVDLPITHSFYDARLRQT